MMTMNIRLKKNIVSPSKNRTVCNSERRVDSIFEVYEKKTEAKSQELHLVQDPGSLQGTQLDCTHTQHLP